MAPLLCRLASRLTSNARQSNKMAANYYNPHLLPPQHHLTDLIKPRYGVPRSSMHNFSTSTDPISIEICMPYKGHKVEPPSTTVETSAKELMEFYTVMTRMRRMEIVSDLLYKAKLIRGFCHLYDGQEAICVGMEASLTKQDNIITGYRDHCFQLTRGSTVQSILEELMGRKNGCTLGKGGSMHFYNKPNGFYGGHGIVGAQMPLGAGLAFAQKYGKLKNVSCTLYGDGASNQGQLFETLNMAALWNLPIIFICENNHYGMGTAEWRASKSPEFYKRGDYVPGLRVDGMNPLAVKQAIKFAKEYVLEKGPLMIEMDTYRYHGHSMSDPGSTYRTRDEIADVRAKRDPIEKVKKYILEYSIATEEELKNIDKDIKKEIDEALALAKASPEPDTSMLWKHIHVKGKDIKLYGCDRKHSTISSE